MEWARAFNMGLEEQERFAVQYFKDTMLYGEKTSRHAATGANNVIQVAKAIADIVASGGGPGTEFYDHVDVRFGHGTWITSEGAKLMRAAHVSVDVNLFSNLATSAMPWQRFGTLGILDSAVNGGGPLPSASQAQTPHEEKEILTGKDKTPKEKLRRAVKAVSRAKKVGNALVKLSLDHFDDQAPAKQALAFAYHGVLPALAAGVVVCPVRGWHWRYGARQLRRALTAAPSRARRLWMKCAHLATSSAHTTSLS